MSEVLELINEVRQAGATLRADPPDLVIKPADRLTPDLKERLKQNKAEVLRRLELEASMKRLESLGVTVAVWEDGSMRVVVTEREAVHSTDGGATIYSPADMYHYVRIQPHERRLLHAFKKRFGGTVDWKRGFQ